MQEVKHKISKILLLELPKREFAWARFLVTISELPAENSHLPNKELLYNALWPNKVTRRILYVLRPFLGQR